MSFSLGMLLLADHGSSDSSLLALGSLACLLPVLLSGESGSTKDDEA